MFVCHGVQRGLHGLRGGNLIDIPRELGVLILARPHISFVPFAEALDWILRHFLAPDPIFFNFFMRIYTSGQEGMFIQVLVGYAGIQALRMQAHIGQRK